MAGLLHTRCTLADTMWTSDSMSKRDCRVHPTVWRAAVLFTVGETVFAERVPPKGATAIKPRGSKK